MDSKFPTKLRPEKNVPPPSGHTTQKHVLANPWKSETPFATTTIYNGKLRKLSKITGENRLNVCSSLPGFPSGPRPARRVRSSKKPSTRHSSLFLTDGAVVTAVGGAAAVSRAVNNVFRYGLQVIVAVKVTAVRHLIIVPPVRLYDCFQHYCFVFPCSR